MREHKRACILALTLAVFWLGGGWSRSGADAQQTQHLDASAQAHIRHLIASLPRDSFWRHVLEHFGPGDGVHYAWMDHMRDHGIKLAIVTYDFSWTENGREIDKRTFVSVQYFHDYDENEPVMDREDLAALQSDGLQQELEAAALPRAKKIGWFEYPPMKMGLGYDRVYMADDEWLPVKVRMLCHGEYPEGLTPLMRAALLGDTDRIEKLLSGGAEVNQVSNDGSTALMWAAVCNHPATLKALVNAGAEVFARSRDGGTALMSAAASDKPKNVQLLLNLGADPAVKNDRGETALSIARCHHYNDVTQLLEQPGAR